MPKGLSLGFYAYDNQPGIAPEGKAAMTWWPFQGRRAAWDTVELITHDVRA